MAERVLRMGVSLFVGIYVTRYLGPTQFGLLSYANSFVGLFIVLATLGLDAIVVRELVKKTERRDELLGAAFWLKLGGAFLMLAGIAAAVPLTQNDTETNTLIAIISFAVIFQAFNVIDFHYQAQVQSKYVVYAHFAQLVVSSVIKLSFIAIKAPLIWFAWCYLLDAVVLATGLIIFYLGNTGKLIAWQWQWQSAKELLKESWPLILSGFVISIYMKIDQLMIKDMLGAEEVGLYAAAVRLTEAWYFIPMAVCTSIFPAIINAKKRSEELYYQRLQKLYNLMVWMGIVIALPTTFLAPWIIELLYGEAYIGAAKVLSIHIWAGVFIFLGVASDKWFLSENLQVLSFYRTLLGAVVNVILNIFLIKKYGIYGAAIATLVAQMSASYIFNLLHIRTRKTFWMETRAFIPIIKKNYVQ